ncbi:MAG: hypothetical protein OEZ06_05130 [Myxococcales bacterium]|nr:hypothetical protein [Myxococcales bacterium]
MHSEASELQQARWRRPGRAACGTGRWPASALLLLLLSTRVAGQLPQPAPGDDATPAVLVLLPAIEPAAVRGLRDAMEAQFSLLDVSLHFELDASGATSLGARLAEAKALSDQIGGAAAVFWIDPQTDGRWLMHLMDPLEERIVVRAIELGEEAIDGSGAQAEAAAVMARVSAQALLSGQPLPAELAVEPPVEPAPDPAPRAPPPERAPPAPALRLFTGYSGIDFAEEVGFRHGLGLGLTYLGLKTMTVSVESALQPTMEVEHFSDDGTSAARLEVFRVPLRLYAGYRRPLGPVELELQGGGLIEIQRSTTHVDTRLLRSEPPAQARGGRTTVEAEPQATHSMWGLSLRVHAYYPLTADLGAFAGLGLDLIPNNFPYYAEEELDDGTSELVWMLSAHRLRPLLQLGLWLYP